MPALHKRATVRWCSRMPGNGYKAGLIFSDRTKSPHLVGDDASLK
jgi:hypothetical protein